jgi:hypothetical protein
LKSDPQEQDMQAGLAQVSSSAINRDDERRP